MAQSEIEVLMPPDSMASNALRAVRRLLALRTLPVLVTGALAPLLLLARPDFVDPLAGVLFVLAIWVALVPAYLALARPEKSPLPLLPLAGLFYIVFFALPPFFIQRPWWTLGNPTNGIEYGAIFERIPAFTAGLVLGAVVMLLAGYYALRRLLPRSLPALALPHVQPSWPLRALLWTLALLHLLYLNIPELRAHSTLTQAVTPVGYFALGTLFVLALRGRMSRVERVCLWALLMPLVVLSHLREGLITPTILVVAFLLGLFWYVRRRPGTIFAVAVCCVFLAFPVMKSPGDVLGAVHAALGREPPHADAAPAPEILTPILRRISLVVLLQYSVDWTPDRVPYLEGATLRNLLTNPVPRFLWRDKPEETLGQWFGHKYQILAPDDFATSINVPWLVEFYVNFGWAGVLLGMAAVGALMAALEAVFLAPGMTDIEIVAGWSLIFRLFYQESNLSLMLGGLPAQILFLVAFLHVALRIVARMESA